MKNIILLAILVVTSGVLFAGFKKKGKKDDIVATTFTLNASGTYGYVSRIPNLTAYNSGTTVQLIATPNSGYTFVSWSGDATGSTNPLTVTMDADKNITVNFTELVVNVKSTGATGNGSTDDTKAIQAAVDQVAANGSGTVYVPDGTYMINALVSVNLKSNMTFQMSSGAVLKAIPNASTHYVIVKIADASNVNVVGGTIQGERDQHLAPAAANFPPSNGIPGDSNCPSFNDCYGQWGMGIGIYGGSAIYIEGVLARDCWGDGFYVDSFSANVNFYSVVADRNRRQGLSVVSADGVVVKNSIFKNTRGHNPQAGIDLEPDAGNYVSNVQILNSQFLNNYFAGIALLGSGTVAPLSNVIISGNTLTDDEIRLSYASNVSATGNSITANLGFFTYGGLANSTITGNTVTAPNCFWSPQGFERVRFIASGTNLTINSNGTNCDN